MVTHFKCPNCGADMEFDTASGMLKCDSCGREENIENMPVNKQHPKGVKVTYDMDYEDKKAYETGFDNDYADPLYDDDQTHHSTFSEMNNNTVKIGAVLGD